MRPPLVLFDLDNTLVDRAASFGRWATRFAEARSLGPPEVDWLVAADEDGFADRRAFLAAVQQRYAVPGSLEVLLEEYRAALVAAVELDPAVPPALESLRAAGWRIAIATNGTAGQQAAKIRQAGLDRLVDAVAISGEVGAAKPDRRLFEAAAERCGADLASGGWMVGDCPVRDVAGAQRLGLRTIWMRRGRAWNSAAAAAFRDAAPAQPTAVAESGSLTAARPTAAPPTAVADDVPAAAVILLDELFRGQGS